MNLQAIDMVVRRLFSDADFRSQAIADPTTTFAEYRLAAAEQQALTKLCVRLADGQMAMTGPKVGSWW